LIAAGLSFLSLILGFFLLHESLPKEQRETAPIRPVDINPFASIGAMARKPRLGLLLLVLCLFNFAFNGINSTQTLFVIDRFDAQPWQVGLLLTLIGIVVIVVQVLLVGRVVPRYGEKPVAIASLLGQATLSVAIFFVPGFWLVLALSVLSSMVSAFTFPTMTTLTSNTVEPREQGVLMGVTTALNSLMTILSPLSAGVAYDRIMVGAPYWMGAVPFVLAAFLLMRSPVGER
jgi:DHA1 family tetracycline resistance protein-like MFS transporter